MTELATLLGWGASILIIVSYVASVVRGNPLILHWGNVIGAVVLVPVQVYLGVAFAGLLSLCFGLVGAVALYKHWREPRVSIVTPRGVTVVE